MKKKESLNETMNNESEVQSENTSKEEVSIKNKLSKKDNSPAQKLETDNNCYTDFSSVGGMIVSNKDEHCQEKSKSVFENLSKVNVNDKVELKNKMKYLSWAYAWGEAKKHYPNMASKVYETTSGINYFTDGRTCWVKVGVTIEGLEHIEYYPVTDYRNVSIPLAKLTSFDVNTAIQRGLTKAIARHGLGLYVYAGEDVPEEIQEIVSQLDTEIEKYGLQSERLRKSILDKYKVRNLNELSENQINETIDKLKNFKKKDKEN